MMKYFISASWPDPSQPLQRIYDNIDAELDDLSSMAAWEIVKEIEKQNWRLRNKGIAVHFMMALGE